MADSAMTPSCLFFNDKMANMPSTAEMMKRKYCRGNYSNCARFIVLEARGKEGVPADLAPNETKKKGKAACRLIDCPGGIVQCLS